MICFTLPAQQFAECLIITYHVKVAKAVRATPYTGEQPQNELCRFVTSVGILNRDATLRKMLFKTAFHKHLEEQGKSTERSDFLIHELYITVSYHNIWHFVVVKLASNYESKIYEIIFLMAVIRKR